MAVAQEPYGTAWNQPLNDEEWCHVAIDSGAPKGPWFIARGGCGAGIVDQRSPPRRGIPTDGPRREKRPLHLLLYDRTGPLNTDEIGVSTDISAHKRLATNISTAACATRFAVAGLVGVDRSVWWPGRLTVVEGGAAGSNALASLHRLGAGSPHDRQIEAFMCKGLPQAGQILSPASSFIAGGSSFVPDSNPTRVPREFSKAGDD
jgi:hypothetical protein